VLAALFGLLFSLFAWKSSSKIKFYKIKRWFLRIYISSAKNQPRFALLYRKLALKILWFLAKWELGVRSRFGIWKGKSNKLTLNQFPKIYFV